MERLRKESYGKIGKSKGQTTSAPKIPNLGGLTTTIQRTSVRWRPKLFAKGQHYADERQRRRQVARTTTVRDARKEKDTALTLTGYWRHPTCRTCLHQKEPSAS